MDPLSSHNLFPQYKVTLAHNLHKVYKRRRQVDKGCCLAYLNTHRLFLCTVRVRSAITYTLGDGNPTHNKVATGGYIDSMSPVGSMNLKYTYAHKYLCHIYACDVW